MGYRTWRAGKAPISSCIYAVVHIAEGLTTLLTLGFYVPAWYSPLVFSGKLDWLMYRGL